MAWPFVNQATPNPSIAIVSGQKIDRPGQIAFIPTIAISIRTITMPHTTYTLFRDFFCGVTYG